MKKIVLFITALLVFCNLTAEENAKVYLMRPMLYKVFGQNNYLTQHYMEIDGHLLGDLGSNTYYIINVEPGQHVIKGYIGNDPIEELRSKGASFSITVNPTVGNDAYLYVDEQKGKITSLDKKNFDKAKSQGSSLLGSVSYAATISFINGKFYNKQGDILDEESGLVLTNARFGITGAQAQTQQNPQPVVSSQQKKERILSDVDQNIPTTKNTADDTYVLIVANEEYQFLDHVTFASYDGETFKEYCIKTLGVPERQVRYCPNASYGILSGGVDWLTYALNEFEGSRAIVYYCGHGIPDEKTGDAFIIPVDGNGTNTATCYSLNKLYMTLAATKATNVTYFMDACFTGANKEGSMLVAARGVAREAKKEILDGNTVVFSASSGDETAMTYDEKQHGLFTYYLLKKLQETEGNVTYEDLAAYISKNVKKDAFLLNEKPQTPVVATSPDAAATWKSMKLK